MAKYYQDFVGLNVLIYEMNGWDPDQQYNSYVVLGMPYASNRESRKMNDAGSVLNVSVFLNHIGGYQGWEGVHLIHGLNQTKNFNFRVAPHSGDALALPTTASFFPALMLHRNGPYGWPSWKQIRIGENPLTRKQRKHNIMTIVDEPGEEFEFRQGNKIRRGRDRYGSILKYDECPIVSKYDPVSLFGGSAFPGSGLYRLKIKTSLGNETSHFDNQDLNKKLGITTLTSRDYDKMISLYLNGGLASSASPIDVVEVVKYKETVYPPLLYTFKNYTRQRTTFSFPWNDDRYLRTKECTDNGFGTLCVSQSVWPMDVDVLWTTYDSTITDRWNTRYGYNENDHEWNHYGILQNMYSSGDWSLPGATIVGILDSYVRVAPLYACKHLIKLSSSVVSQNGMRIEGINYGTSMGDMYYKNGVPGGEAKWETPSQSGKAPFYNSYDDYIQGVKQLGKDYTIIPEFRISNHVSKYHTQGLNVLNPHFLELTGGLLNTTGSNQTNFYTIFSNSDFLENFKMVREQHKDLVEPVNIKLTCKAIKKLLPYNGFYPQQRTVDIAKQFYDSYKDYTTLSGAAASWATSKNNQIAFQNLLRPIAAPGVLFNSIKSGVACDFPLAMTASMSGASGENIYQSGSLGPFLSQQKYDDWHLTPPLQKNLYSGGSGTHKLRLMEGEAHIFDKRIPFEVLVEPEKHLAGVTCYSNEPHPCSNTTASCTWDGQGNNLFKLMSHNFLAETSNFFLKNEKYTTLYSKPNNNPMVGMAQAGMCYSMRVKMFKTAESSSLPAYSVDNQAKRFPMPQYNSASYETFTMYSRPSAFGPAYTITGSGVEYSNGGVLLSLMAADPGSAGRFGPRAENGENYAFTPPYYYGQAWADISFVAGETRKYSLHEILTNITTSYLRYIDETTAPGSNLFDRPSGSSKTVNRSYAENICYNADALQLSASVNLFGLEREKNGDLNEETARWVIQTKWETPMLNFNHLSASTSITLPLNASQSVPRGMWHQYGLIEEDSAKGIFMQITDIPEDWTENALGNVAAFTGSLADLVGFASEPTRLGEIADSKKIWEAVVAVPFIEEEGEQKFFTLPREDINLALDPDRNNRVGISVKNMVQKMQKYVFPPSMDFLASETIEPIAMYIFEFSHVLSKQDLADIWQGLYPDVTATMETAESSISHNLLAHELLGGGAIRVNENDELFMDQGAKGTKFPDKLKWMVFKVKQRAKINYFDNIVSRAGDDVPGAIVDSTGVNVSVSYNWPYDYFSLVELGKIDAEVSLGKFKDKGKKQLLEPVISEPEPETPQFTAGMVSTTVGLQADTASGLASGPGSSAGFGGFGFGSDED